MSKLKENRPGIFTFWCPGCKETHAVYTDAWPGKQERPRWGYNGNDQAPTFTPSLLLRTGHYVKGQPQPPECKYCEDIDDPICTVCHSFVTDGHIRFLSDCTHDLAGQTVPLPNVEDWPHGH